MRAGFLTGVASCAIVAAAGPALAADITYRGDDRWSGVYFGGHIGAGGVNPDGWGSATSGEADYGGIARNGAVGGLQAGLRRQDGNLVYGFVADISGTGWRDAVVENSGTYVHSLDTRFVTTLRATLGHTFGNALVYATAGGALHNGTLRITSVGDPYAQRVSSVGGVVGLGVETAVTDRVSVGVETLYHRYLSDSDAVGADVDGIDGSVVVDDGFTGRVFANWRLDGVAGGLPHGYTATDPDFWTGPYVGLDIGYGGLNPDGPFHDHAADFGGAMRNGPLAGGHIGVNRTHGDWVYGLEADIATPAWDDAVMEKLGDTHSFETDLLASASARAGRVIGETLLTGSAGIAFTTGSLTLEDAPDEAELRVDAVGLVLGAGAETRLSDRVSAGIVGQYFLFDEAVDLEGTANGVAGDTYRLRDGFLAKARLTVHID